MPTTRAGATRVALVVPPLMLVGLLGLIAAGFDAVLVLVAGLALLSFAVAMAVLVIAVRVTWISRDVAGLRRRADRQRDAINSLRPHITKAVRESAKVEFRQIEALLALRDVLDLPAPLPATRGWAASPDLLLVLERIVREEKPMLVVECGGGTSSVVIAHALAKFGGRLVVLEHDPRFRDSTQQGLAAQGLSGIAEVRLAELTDVPELQFQGESFKWYDPKAILDLKEIDLIVADGPPQATGKYARYPALPLLWAKSSARLVVVLDDTIRQDEADISAAWCAEHPELRAEDLPLEKGCHILRR
jgi:predicted O-methyltransferase YrrM